MQPYTCEHKYTVTFSKDFQRKNFDETVLKTLIPGTQAQGGKTGMSAQPADSSKQVGIVGAGFREKGIPASP